MADNKNKETDAAQNEAAQNTELADLQAKLEALQQERDNAVADLSTALSVNDDLQTKLKNAEETVEKVFVVITHKKAKYKVTVKKFQYKEEVYTAEQLKNEPEIIEALLAKKSEILKPFK